jgi:myo-inositol-1(or 4)-monophosphatase
MARRPIRRTANIVYGRADFAVSVGERADGKPVAGAILRPADGRWLVTSDQGVYVGRESESARNAVPDIRSVRLADSLITVGLPYSLTARQDALSVIAQLAPLVRGFRVVGSAAGDLAALTLGQCDGFIGFGLAEWDTAAGHALVIKAGGVVRDRHHRAPD